MSDPAPRGSDSPDALLQRLRALHPRRMDLALDRILLLLERLAHPERALPPVVHVAGTNGKGSVIAYLKAALEAAGRTVHVYTSPHLVRFNERILLAGRPIEDAPLAALLEECERANAGAPITEFEITTVAAFLAFARAPADWLLLETGLGGRLDATNVVERPALSIITPISLDHQAFLGDTLAAIATEKAGIMKRGVPVVSALQPPDALSVLRQQAERTGAPLFQAERDWRWQREGDGFVYEDGHGALRLPPPGLPGAHQWQNAATAVAALRRLPGPGLPIDPLTRGLSEAAWPARLQRLRRGPLPARLPDAAELWLDGGHNPAAGAALAETLAQWQRQDAAPRPLLLICGMLENKDAAGFLAPFAPLQPLLAAVPIPGEACHTAEALAALAEGAGLAAAPAASLEAALARTPPGARVLLCGSLYLAGQVLAENG